MTALSDDDFRRLAEEMRALTDNVRASNDPLVNARRRFEESNSAIEKETQARKESAEATKRTVTNFLNWASVIANSRGNLTALNSTVDLTIGKLGRLGDTTAQLIKYSADNYEKLFQVFQNLSNVGVVKTVEDVRDSMKNTDLALADLNEVLGKYSKQLAYLGSSTLEGRKAFEKVAAVSSDLRTEFQRIGVTFSDFNEYQLSYLNRLQQSGFAENKTREQLSQGTKEYILQLDSLSKLTGQSRKEIQQEMEARMRDTRFRATIAGMTEQQQKELQSVLSLLPKDLSEGMKDLIASGGAATTEASKALVTTYGNTAIEISQALRAGTIPAHQAFNALRDISGSVQERFTGLAGIIGDASIVTRLYVTSADLAKRKNLESMTELERAAQERMKTDGDLTGSLADTRSNVYRTGQAIELLATSSIKAAKALSAYSDITLGLVQKVQQMMEGKFNLSTTPGMESGFDKLKGLGIDVTRDVGNFVLPEFVSSMFGSIFGAMGVGKSTPAATGTPTTTPTPATGAPTTPTPEQTSLSDVDKYIAFQGGITGHRKNFDQLDPMVQQRLLSMAKDYHSMTNGSKLKFTSGFRNEEDNKAVVIQKYGYLPADYDKRGKPHMTGRAIDIDSSQVRDMNARGLLQQYGFRWAGENDPVHIQMRNGGVAKGPASGFPVQLHGRELVQPLDSNSILEKLARTSADDLPTTDSSSISAEIGSALGRMTDIFAGFQSKQDEMIRELSGIKNLQQTILMRRYA